MITHAMEAVASEGGPASVKVDGWMCGRIPSGILVRIVFLRPVNVEAIKNGSLIPVIFEDGRLAGSGWELLEGEPCRHGVPIMRAGTDWSAPLGWISVR